MKVQLLAFAGCPNAAPTRLLLTQVLRALRVEASIEEIDTATESCPVALRRWGSPTVLINGVDVEGGEPDGGGCRVYRSATGMSGVPTEESLVAAIRRSAEEGVDSSAPGDGRDDP